MIALDLLGLGSKNWPLKATLKTLPDNCAIGCFDDAPGLFGDPRKNLRALLVTGKVRTVRVQLWYTKAHTIVPLEFMKKRLPLWSAFAKEFPNVCFRISHTTEHRSKNRAELRQRLDLISSFGNLYPVNNPEPRAGMIIEGVENETHGDRPLKGKYLASQDGRGWYDMNTIKWLRTHEKAELSFVWIPLFNMNDLKAPIPVPYERTAAPKEKDFLAAIAAGEAPPPAPKPVTFKGKIFKRPMLYKPMSQDTGDNREGKPMIIVPPKSPKFTVITKDGDPIGTLPFYANYGAQGYRYYSGSPGGVNLWGYELAERALKVSGSSWVWVSDGKNIYGPIQPAFRFGYYRS